MDLNRLTQKSQEALTAAQALATRNGHTEVDGEHLLMALIDQPEGLVPRLLAAMDVDTRALRRDLEAEISRKARTTGPAPQPGSVSITQRLARVLGAAAGRVLAKHGVTHDAFLAALTQVRGNQRVTSATPEGVLRGAHEVWDGPRGVGAFRLAGPGDRPRFRDPPRGADPVERIATDRRGRIKLAKVNVDAAPRLSQRFEIRAVPTLMVFRDGELSARQAGAAPEPALRSWLDGALSGSGAR
jgi:Clp amino terminal domain, pathogenicity island component/Thioredoxin